MSEGVSEATGRWDKWRSVLPIAYALAIFYGGVINIGELPHTPFVPTDKLLHAGAFLGLEVLCEWALYLREARSRQLLSVLASAGVGGTLELVQAALPYRSADFWDFFADSVGAVVGAIGIYLLTRALRGAPRGEPS
ncbi:MAG: VanZ family protein [Polyangiaceae bacterium]